MSEPKVEYIEQRANISEAFMSVFGMTVERALLSPSQGRDGSGDTLIDAIWSLLVAAIKKDSNCARLSQDEGSSLDRIVYDVNYTEEGEPAPQFIVYWKRPKTESDRERDQQNARQDLTKIKQIVQKNSWSIHVFNTPEQYGRFGTVQHTAVSGPPSQTGSYLLWIDPHGLGSESPVSFYYDAEKNVWRNTFHDREESDVPAFTAYMGPIPVKLV